jgi:tetratricopeptide (TPR) repeat protein
MWDKALAYFREAGEKAMTRSAHREAAGYFEQALGALPHLPETRDRREQAIDLRLALRTALSPSGNFERVLAYLHEAEALAVALDDSRRLGHVLLFLSELVSLRGAYDQAIAAAQRALTLATAGEAGVLSALANASLGRAYYAQGDYRQAIDCYRQAVAFLDGTRRRERFGYVIPPAVTSRTWFVLCHAELGLFAEGRPSGEEGLRIAEAVEHSGSLMVASWGAGVLSLRHGDLPRALPLLERAVSICQDPDLSVWFTRIAPYLGMAYTLAGRVADAVSLLAEAMQQSAAAKRVNDETLCSLSLGEAQTLAGRLEEAHTLAERALTLARGHQHHGHQAYTLHLLGEIAARRAPPQIELAEAHYHQALTLADELGMRPLMAHCHCRLGMLYATIGRREQARAELSVAIALYRAMDMTFWSPQAEAALEQVV